MTAKAQKRLTYKNPPTQKKQRKAVARSGAGKKKTASHVSASSRIYVTLGQPYKRVR